MKIFSADKYEKLMEFHDYLVKNYLKIDAKFPPKKWAATVQKQNLDQTFFTTNNSQESLNAYLAKDLPPGEITFHVALSHVNTRMVQLQLKEDGLTKVKEFRKQVSMALTKKRCTRYRQAKKLKNLTPKKSSETGYKDQKQSVRVSMLIVGETHRKHKPVGKEEFNTWFFSYKSE